MGKKSRQKRQRTAQKTPRSAKVSKGRWNLGHLIAAFLLGAVLGFIIGYEPGDGGAQSTTDAFGRSPGDPHYSHRHP